MKRGILDGIVIVLSAASAASAPGVDWRIIDIHGHTMDIPWTYHEHTMDIPWTVDRPPSLC